MNKIQKYFAYRQSLIDQFVSGDMTKSEYLDRNYDAVMSLRKEPFKYLDNVDKCLFNYQFYNALAKEAKMELSSNSKSREQLLKQADYYYTKKDQATLKALTLMDYAGVKAYYIKVRSKTMKGRLFEIQLSSCYMNMILHSMNEVIQKKLEQEGVFEKGIKVSGADMYINQRY